MPVERWTLGNMQRLVLAGLKGRKQSFSYAPAEEEPVCARMLAELEDVFGRYQDSGTVTVLYGTRLYVGRL
jgi:hypothetical protein